ncbi:MAG: tetratricopeptide repeat protein [Acidobacteriota bacterium]
MDEALEACRRAAAIAPGSPPVLTGLADTLSELRRYGEAQELYGQAVDLDHEAIAPQLGAAANLVKARSMSMARLAYDSLLENWDYGRDRALLGAAALMVIAGEYEAALDLYGRITIPENASLPTLLALYGKGFCLMKVGRQAEAEYFLSTLVDRVPGEYDGPAKGREFLFRAYEDLVRYFSAKGRERKVLSLLRSACDRPLAPVRLARRLSDILESRGREEDAALVLEEAILRSDPREDPLDLGDAALRLARRRTSNGRRRVRGGSEAARALRLAAERIAGCDLGIAHYRLARAQALLGDGASAIESLARARGHGYLPTDLLEGEADFDSLRGEEAFRRLLDR